MSKTPAQFKVGDLVGHHSYPHCFGIIVPDEENLDIPKVFWWITRRGAARQPSPRPATWCLPKNLILINRAEQR